MYTKYVRTTQAYNYYIALDMLGIINTVHLRMTWIQQGEVVKCSHPVIIGIKKQEHWSVPAWHP